MDPLVESLLRSSLEEDEPERSPDASDFSDTEERSSKSVPQDDVPENLLHGGRQTGPKGVLADHAYHKQQVQQQKAASLAAYNERMLSKAFTTTTFREDEVARTREEEILKDLENLSSDEEEEQALKKYREQRIREIREKAATRPGNRKRFGSLREISSSQYVKSIDDEAPDVSVIVHLYENSIPQCRLLNDCLTQLARKFVGAKFLRILAHDVDFDSVGLPAVLVYKNGELIVNLVKITDEIGETDFNIEIVENVLIRHGALNPSEEDDVDKLQFS